jgi:hypothetical protein
MLAGPERDWFTSAVEFLHRLTADHSPDLTLPEMSDITVIEITVVHLRKLLDSD